MKAWIYIERSGLEKIALGQDLWSWDFAVRTAPEGLAPQGPQHSFLSAACIPLTLPSSAGATVIALDGLEARLADARAEAHREELEILERINKLQAITYDVPEAL